MWIKRQLVMLPANEKANVGEFAIMLNSATGIKPYLSSGIIQRSEGFNMKCEKQHLYIIKDEEIKEGEWFISSLNNLPCKLNERTVTSDITKIIASTDKLRLITKDEFGGIDCQHLPQPSQSFIEKFVEEYNKGRQISEVLVEYERLFKHNGFMEREFFDALKINPKDNTITIRKVDLKGEHIINFVNDFIKEFPEQNLEYLKLRAESWIEENL